MRKKPLLAIISILVFSTSIFSQGLVDALRYSKMQNLGTARYTAMGGSFGALGGEVSGIMNNPGGLGIYRSSEITISTSLSTISTNNQFRGNEISESNTTFNIPNFGYVSTSDAKNSSWEKYSFAFGHNRIANFQNTTRIKGNSNNGSSFVDPYIFDLNNNQARIEDVINYASPYTFGPSHAVVTTAILHDSTNNEYFRFSIDDIQQERLIETEGRQTETFFAFGGNFENRLFIGASIGIQNIRLDQEQIWFEEYSYDTPPPDGIIDIDSYRESSTLRTRGTGFNFKIGGIYKINNEFRVGASFHSPTYFGMTEEFLMESQSELSDATSIQSDIIQSIYDYRFRTPWRLQGSFAYVYGSSLLLNIDYEFQNFSNSRFDDTNQFPFDYSFVNDDISAILQQSHHIKAGIEYRLDPFALRGGFRYESNPFSNNTFLNPDESRNTYSIGAGYRNKNYNIDLSYMLSSFDIIDPVYEGSGSTAMTQETHHLVSLTFGLRW